MKRISFIVTVLAVLLGAVSCNKAVPEEQIPLEKVSLSIIPDYSDGSVHSCSDDGSFFLRVSVTPEKYLSEFSNDGKYVYKADFRKVTAKSLPEGGDFSVTGEVSASFEKEGYMTVAFTIADAEAAALLLNDYAVSFSIRDAAGGAGSSTTFVPVSFDDEKGLGGKAVCKFVVHSDTLFVKLSDEKGISEDVVSVEGTTTDGRSILLRVTSRNGLSLVLRFEDGSVLEPVEKGKYSYFLIPDIASDVTAILEYWKYTVTFAMNGHGTAPDPVLVLKGSTFTKPEDPVADGYAFEGWFSDEQCTKAWDFATEKVTADITLYAKWKTTLFDFQTLNVGNNKVTLKFYDDADGGIVNDLIVQATTEGSSVIVKVSSNSGRPLVIRKDDGTVVAPIEDGKRSTFTCPDIASDATFAIAYARKFKVSTIFNADIMPGVEGYEKDFDSRQPKEVLEGRNVKVTVTNFDGYTCLNMSCGEITEEGNTIYVENVCNDIVITANYTYSALIQRPFSVSDTRTVFFSQGNLWYDGGPQRFCFETNQAEAPFYFLGHHLSLFYWSKDWLRSVQFYWLDFDASEHMTLFADRGMTFVGQYFWRTLSSQEWSYLFNLDKNDTKRKGKIKYGVNVRGGGNCVVLLPDDWDENILSLETFASTNSYDLASWSKMEKAGAVCLPTAGRRKSLLPISMVGYQGPADDDNTTVEEWRSDGYYWTSDRTYLHFNSSNASFGGYPDYTDWGLSIRLVTDREF